MFRTARKLRRSQERGAHPRDTRQRVGREAVQACPRLRTIPCFGNFDSTPPRIVSRSWTRRTAVRICFPTRIDELMLPPSSKTNHDLLSVQYHGFNRGPASRDEGNWQPTIPCLPLYHSRFSDSTNHDDYTLPHPYCTSWNVHADSISLA